jgi:hypothetical protein
MSKCNVCWETLQGTANVAACGHCYCACARTALVFAAPRARVRARTLVCQPAGCFKGPCRRCAPTSTFAGGEMGAVLHARALRGF